MTEVLPRPARRRLFLAAGAAILLCTTALLAFRPADDAAATAPDDSQPPPLLVRSAPAVLSTGYASTTEHAGRVVARRSTSLGFVAGGEVVEVLVDAGDRVEADAPLARIDRSRLEAARQQTLAQIDEIQARLGLARLASRRTATLADAESVSEQRHDEARFEEAALIARLRAARAELARLEVDLDDAILRAPYAGSITARYHDEGAIVAPGEPVLRVVEQGHMEVRVGLPPDDAARLKVGEVHRARVNGREVEVRTRAALDDVAEDTRTVTAIFDVILPAEGLRHGALAKLALSGWHEGPGFWLPIDALSESRRGLWAAYALVPEAENESLFIVERRELEMLHVEDERVYVRGTLVDGERVVLGGVHRLVPGQRVRTRL